MAPKKTTAGEIPVTVRFPPDVHVDATKAAEADDRSFNNYVVVAVREKIAADKKARGR